MQHITRYYSTRAGDTPVAKFVDGLNFKIQQRFYVKESLLLSAYAGNLPPPHVRYLGSGIHELKISFSRLEYRFLFMRISNSIIYLHAFHKKTQKTPPFEIELAKTRMREVFSRLERGEELI